MGTPYYMAPEQAMGRKDVDHRADLWALGVILFRMLTGRYPFSADAFPVLMVEICNTPAPDPTTLRPGIPAPLVQLIARLLEKDPAARPQSAAEVKRALAGERSVDALAATTPAHAPVVSEPTSRAPARATRTPAIALGAIAVAALGAVVYVAASGAEIEDAPVAAPPADPAPASNVAPAAAPTPSAPITVTEPDAGPAAVALPSSPRRRTKVPPATRADPAPTTATDPTPTPTPTTISPDPARDPARVENPPAVTAVRRPGSTFDIRPTFRRDAGPR